MQKRHWKILCICNKNLPNHNKREFIILRIFRKSSGRHHYFRLGIRTGCLLLLLFDNVLKVLARVIRQEKTKSKTKTVGEEEISLSANDIIVNVENPKSINY